MSPTRKFILEALELRGWCLRITDGEVAVCDGERVVYGEKIFGMYLHSIDDDQVDRVALASLVEFPMSGKRSDKTIEEIRAELPVNLDGYLLRVLRNGTQDKGLLDVITRRVRDAAREPSCASPVSAELHEAARLAGLPVDVSVWHPVDDEKDGEDDSNGE